MARNQRPSVAICYDFDGTLICGNMQENSFIPDLGMDKEEFWKEVKKEAKKNEMDEVLAYMELMMRKAEERNKPFNRDKLEAHGKKVKLFPGVKQWFDNINEAGRKLNLKVDHYIISSGLYEMIKGTPIGGRFKYIFASGYAYDANKTPKFAARSINYTTKTQYLFRINKGILNNWDNESVNAYTDDSERPNPFSRMIYLGDGETDIPAMKMLNYQGGYSIVVYPPASRNNHAKNARRDATAKNIFEKNRAQFIAEANYGKNRRLFKIVTALLKRIADEEEYGLNRKCYKA